jgi:hypothetical protein
MTAIEWLQKWYERTCDGTWEHVHGIKIDTLDNPGWQVQVDLIGTPYADLDSHRMVVERSATDWLRYSIEGGKFIGYGDPGKLEAIFLAFREWIEEKRVSHDLRVPHP